MNNGNLIVPSSEKARENGRKGGKKSGEVRRKKAAMKSAMRELLSMPVCDTDIWNACTAMGVQPDDNQTALLVMLFRKAALGDVAAFREIRSIIGEDNDAELLKLKKQELKLKEQKLGNADEELPDDGFLSALNGSVSDDWIGGGNDEN